MSSSFRVLKKRFFRVWWVLLLIASIATAISVLAYKLDLFGMVAQEIDAYDTGLKFWTKPNKRSKDVVIVAIDSLSMDSIDRNELYRKNYTGYPYARSLWAVVFQFLERAGAKAIVFDALMTDQKPDDDSMLRVLNRLKIPVFLGFDLDPYGLKLPKVQSVNRLLADKKKWAQQVEDKNSTEQEKLQRAALAMAFPIKPKGFSLSKLPKEDKYDEKGRSLGKYELLPHPPMESLWDLMSGFGLVITESIDSPDAKMRTTRFGYTDGTNNYATLSLAAAADLLGAPFVEISPGKLKMGRREIAINQDGSAGIDYGGKLLDRFDVVSLIRLLDGNQYLKDSKGLSSSQQQELEQFMNSFRGKIVLIGGFAAGTADIKSNPFEMFVPGVVKHAAEIDSLVSGRFIVDAPFYGSILLAFLVAMFAVLFTLIVRSPYTEVLWPIGLFLLFFLVPGYLIVHAKIHLLSTMPSVAGSLASVGVTVYLRVFEDRNRELFKDLFSHAMEPTLVEEMVEQKNLPFVKGESREVTLLYVGSNLFPSIQLDLTNQNTLIFKTINRYISKINQSVMAHGGCVEHYQQGAMLALFGAPLNVPDHAYHACQAALEIIKSIKELHEDLKRKGLPDIDLQVGLHTDTMLVGNIGNEKFFEYVPLGPGSLQVVDIEKANENCHTKILLSENTWKLVSSQVLVRSVLPAQTNLTFPCYELLYLSNEAIPSAEREKIEIYQQAFELYHKGDFWASFRLISHLYSSDSQDQLIAKLLDACKQKLQMGQ